MTVVAVPPVDKVFGVVYTWTLFDFYCVGFHVNVFRRHARVRRPTPLR